MPLSENDAVRLRHMLEYASKALLFAKGKSRADLDNDEQLRLALVQLIQIVGEAASRVSRKFQEQTPSIPWADIIGTRNRLIHAYFDINLNVLWDTINDDLPPLVGQLQKIIDDADQQQKLF
jgi:uncharacterized protein with HEPN domain